ATALESQAEAVVDQALGVHAVGDTGLAHEVDKAVFQHAGADAAEDVFGGLGLEDDGFDALAVQQLAEQQAGRAGADDGDLSFHGGSPVMRGGHAYDIIGWTAVNWNAYLGH